MLIDSHHHLWQLDRGDYDWITPELGGLNRDYLTPELASILQAAGIEKTVLVQAAETDAETDFILALAENTDFIAGVVGWVDMEKDDVLAKLERHQDNPWLLGIRPVMQDIEDPQWMLQACLDPCYQWIIDHNKTFDALIKPRHLDTLPVLLKRYPELRVVIDHGAKPDIANKQFQPWADKMSAIAQDTQAFCKLSGLVTEADGNISREELTPYIKHLINCFGSDRLMWGSDWPVINMACTYSHWVELSRAIISELPQNQQDAILGNTARDFYQL